MGFIRYTPWWFGFIRSCYLALHIQRQLFLPSLSPVTGLQCRQLLVSFLLPPITSHSSPPIILTTRLCDDIIHIEKCK